MRKALILTILLIAACVCAVGVFASGKGAVKARFDPDAGWAIVNTTASGKLNVTAHVESGLPGEEYSVTVRVRYEDGTVDEHPDIAILSTNGQGIGNAHVQLDIAPPAGSTTLRRVAVRVRKPGPPNVLYVAIVWDIPLKPFRQ